MTSWRKRVEEYVELRRSLWFKLLDAKVGLIQFASFLQQRRVHFLSRPEIDALLGAPNQTTWFGRRDHGLLLVAVQTGLRLSELTGLQRADVVLGTGAHVRCVGKGRN